MYARAGIISDTHGLLRPEVSEQLKDCSLILHGGDIGGQEILNQLTRLAPVRAVRGNNDREWAGKLPLTDTVDFHGVRIFLCHRNSLSALQSSRCSFGSSEKLSFLIVLVKVLLLERDSMTTATLIQENI